MQDEFPTFSGNRVRGKLELDEWHALGAPEPVLDPGLPVVDAHHHLYGSAEDQHHYQLPDLASDLGSGHRVLGTVYIEAYYSGWREIGPEALKPVGEVEKIIALTEQPVQTTAGECQVAAGIVAHANLTLAERVSEVLDAELDAAQGRLRGIRHMSAFAEGEVGRTIADRPKRYLLSDPAFRRGFAQLERYGLSFDAWCYHDQLTELADLADQFPNVPIIIDHVGGVIGVAEYRSKSAEIRTKWANDMRALATRSNIHVKIGGLGMPVFGFGFERAQRPIGSSELAQMWQPFVDTCVDTFGPSRCMFESNFPVDKQSCGYTELWNAFKLTTTSLSDDERRDMLYRTACRIYRLADLAVSGDSFERPIEQE
jgi:L-fuconolactonase